jgi:peroxiredoxin
LLSYLVYSNFSIQREDTVALTETPACQFGQKIIPFTLPGVDGKEHKLIDLMGPKGTVVMFICNHCPYVKAILPRLIEDARLLKQAGIHCIAINPNDATVYQEDSFENMKKLASTLQFPFPYLWDESQSVAKAYEAVCTPDFFGYNLSGELRYRGRLDASKREAAPEAAPRELVDAMLLIARTGQAPATQVPSMGCSIKWKETL